MGKPLIPSLFIFGFFSVVAQPYTTSEYQKTYKDEPAISLNSTVHFQFSVDSKGPKILEEKSRKLLSLRYNQQIMLTEFYDNNSSVEKFYGESSLKQKAADIEKFCNTYTSDGLFYDDSKFCTHVIRLKEIGEAWDIKTTRKISDARYLTTVYFPEEFTVLDKTIRFTIPKNIEVELLEFNFEGHSISKKVTPIGENTLYEYTGKNLIQRKTEPFSRGPQFTHPHILVRTKSYTRNGTTIPFLNSTNELYRWYKSLTDQLAPNAATLSETVNRLTAGKATDEEKIMAIYYWVQDNIRYIAFEDGIAAFKPDEAHKVFEKRYGDCKGMATLTKEMLKIAGFDARAGWIGTSRIRYDQSLATLAANNHMICVVFHQQKKYFLDATEKYVPLKEDAERIQGRPVLIENGPTYLVETVPTVMNANKDARSFEAVIEKSNLKGDYSISLNGEDRKNLIYQYQFTESDKRKELVESFISEAPSAKPSEVILPDMTQRSGELSIKSKLTLENVVSNFNDDLYIDIDPLKSFTHLEMKPERQSDLDFGRKINNKLKVALQIPKDYSVAFLPPPLSIKQDSFNFEIEYTQQGDKILYSRSLVIPSGVVLKKEFKTWNEAIKNLNQTYETQLVLKKQK